MTFFTRPSPVCPGVRTGLPLLLALVAGCASARAESRKDKPIAPQAATPSPTSAPRPKPALPSPRASASPPTRPTAPAKPAPQAGAAAKKASTAAPDKQEPSACPSGMLLVDGEYCTKVEHTCVKSWYDEANKKTVCEQFEPVSKCVGQKVKKRFCIDRYTWPNEHGARPEVMNRFHQAQLKCAAVDKRLCAETEWTLACEGPRMLPFPYGYARDARKCHGDMEWDSPDMPKVAKRDPEELARLWRGVRNGSQPECVSEFGVPDLPGNVDEVVSSETQDGTWRGKFDSVHTGGPWYKGTRNQCRPKIYTHDEGFYYYFLGFRCCAEPDGKPTEPRTARQMKEGWKLSRVEGIAGFGLNELRKKLDEKRKGNCACGEKDIKCRTMCGTLLGPTAKDYR